MYGSWVAAYALFRRWQRNDTSRGITIALQALADAAGGIVCDVKANHDHLRAREIKATIPSKVDRDANRRKKGSKGGRNVTPWNTASTCSAS